MELRSSSKRESKRRSLAVFSDQDTENEMDATPSRKVINPGETNAQKNAPFTPVENVVASIRERLEKRLQSTMPSAVRQPSDSDEAGGDVGRFGYCDVQSSISPSLAKLRMTPAAKGLKAKQELLMKKHQETKNRSDQLQIGGGVCIWPGMEDMRLTKNELIGLILFNVLLIPLTTGVFYMLHGDLLFSLLAYTERLHVFHQKWPVIINGSQEQFNQHVFQWHLQFQLLMQSINDELNTSLCQTSIGYKMGVIMYCLGIGTLLYFLVDNILAKSKLSPRRIKSWVTLLCVIGLWTIFITKLLIFGIRLENAVAGTVRHYMAYLAELVNLSLDLNSYHNVRIYWQTRCLPPTAYGTLTVMGLVPLQDIVYYLQYYSLPIVTALLSPIIKLLVSLREVYSVSTPRQQSARAAGLKGRKLFTTEEERT